MKLSLLTFFSLFFIVTSIFSQQKIIEGKVQNSTNLESLAYVNIRVIGLCKYWNCK